MDRRIISGSVYEREKDIFYVDGQVFLGEHYNY